MLSSQGMRDIGPSQLRYLRFGRVVDTTRMREQFGFTPQYTTEEALQAYLVDSGTEPLVTRASLERSTAKVAAVLPRPVAARLKRSLDRTVTELEALGALPDPIEEEPA